MKMSPRTLWEPPDELVRTSNLTRFMNWLSEERGLAFQSYRELWRWSVDDLESFWASFVEYQGVRFRVGPGRVLAGSGVEGTSFFPDAQLNYAEHALLRPSESPAIIYRAVKAHSRDPFIERERWIDRCVLRALAVPGDIDLLETEFGQ